MASNSGIEWTDHTMNLWWGCRRVHAGCDNCYAADLAHRFNPNQPLWDDLDDGTPAPRRFVKSGWNALNKWQREAQRAGVYRRVFVGSMMDIFEKPQPLINNDGLPIMSMKVTLAGNQFEINRPINTGDLRKFFFDMVVPNFPNLMFLLLTKRPSLINKYTPTSWKAFPPRNVMFGATVVDEESMKTVYRHLPAIRGAKFLSMEPMLGPVPVEAILPHVDWVIVGGESGPKKRPFNPAWARRIKRACDEYETSFFMKQIDKVKPIPDDLMIREFPNHHLWDG